MEIDTTIFTQGALVAFSLVFLGGVVTSIGPCNVAMIPLLVGYVGGTTTPTRGRAFALSIGFAIGLATTFMLLLDAKGAIVWREWGVASNPEIFDLARVEAKINTLLSMTDRPGISMTFVTNRVANNWIYFKNC